MVDKTGDTPLSVEDYFPIIVGCSTDCMSTMMDMEEKETLVWRKESQGEREITYDNALKIDETHVNATIELTTDRNETITVLQYYLLLRGKARTKEKDLLGRLHNLGVWPTLSFFKWQ